MKKNRLHQYIILVIIFCLAGAGLKVFAGNVKLQIATNKEKYTTAEAVQFQVFLLNPSSKLSRTVFAELWDCNGNKLSKKMLPLDRNVSSGIVELPGNDKAAFYLLYCYILTDDSIACSSVKKIFLSENTPSLPGNAGSKITATHFFEGGTFIAESPNKILIKCMDENAKPVKAKGKLTDGKDAIYNIFETDEEGYATILFNPESKVQYYIVMKDSKAHEITSSLPLAEPAGITLNITTAGDSIFYNILSYSPVSSQPAEYRLEALQNGQLVYDAAASFMPGLSVIKEPLKASLFGPGFITFRITDKSNKIYARRVIYNQDKAAENFISVIDTVNKREARVLLPGILSGKSYIAIHPQDPVSATNNQDFLYVGNNISINDQLIGYPDIEPETVTENDESNRYLSLNGTLFNFEKKPLKNKTVNLVIMQKNLKKQFLVAKTDNEGKLKIDNLIFFDTATVYYQLADKSEEKNDVFMALNVTPGKVTPGKQNVPASFFCHIPQPQHDSVILSNSAEKTLNQVIVSAGKEKTETEKYSEKYVAEQMKRSHALRNEFDFIKNPEPIDNRSLFVFLQSRIPSLRIWITPLGNIEIRGTNGGSVGVYLNDMELPLNESMDMVKDLQIKDIALVKFYSMSFKPKIIGGDILRDLKASDGGDLLIYTKRDYAPSEEKTKGLPKTIVAGYDVTKTQAVINAFPFDRESSFWKSDWKVASRQTIYITLPAGKKDETYEMVLEGINEFQLPFHFSQKLIFN